jgi:hypothetical protein
LFLNAFGYLVLLAAAVFFFYVDVFFLGVACVLLVIVLAAMDYSRRRRVAAAREAAFRAAQAQAAAEEDEDEYDSDEYEEEKILIRNKIGKIPPVMRLRIKPKSTRRNTWEMTMQSTGDVLDSVFGTLYRLVSGTHEHEGETAWEAGRGR